jgi:heme exporter protein B
MQTSLMQQIKTLFVKEAKMEWKNRYALFALVLQIVIAGFIVSTINNAVPNKVWHALFYVVLIFGVVQNITRSFLHENKGSLLYYKFLVNPRALVFAKIIYQFVINLIFLGVMLLVMSFFVPQTINHFAEYIFTAVLFILFNSAVFTFNSAISISAKNSSLIASVLSLPLLIPGLLVCLKSASLTMESIQNINFSQDWVILLLLTAIVFLLSGVLFKFVWEE